MNEESCHPPKMNLGTLKGFEKKNKKKKEKTTINNVFSNIIRKL